MLLNPISDKLDIIILAGQSNAEGYGVGKCLDPYTPDPRILSMKDTDNQGFVVDEETVEEFHIAMPRDYIIGIAEERFTKRGKIGCFALSFAREYAKTRLAKDRKLLIIMSAVGATGFAKGLWGVGEVLYTRLLDMVNTALAMNPENRIVSVLWHQGEHDAALCPEYTPAEREKKYHDDLLALILGLRSAFGTQPFIMGGFSPDWTVEREKYIIAAKRALCAELDAVAFVESDGLASNDAALNDGDKIHFSRNSLDLFGKRYYAAFEALS